MPRRRMVPISEDIVDDAIKISERIGIPYLILIERILTSILKIMKYKSNILDALVMLDALDDIKRLGGIVFPASVMSKVFNSIDTKIYGDICKEYNKMGMWFAELSRIKRTVSINEFKQAISLWLPISSIDITAEGEGYKVVIGFIGYGEEIINIARCIIEGLIRGYNLQISELITEDVFIILKVKGFVKE